MSSMARMNGNVVMEVLKPIDGFDIADCFHPDVLVGCVPCANDVQPGWVQTADGFAAPEPEPEPEEEAPPATE
jgi:hypothetical protein